MSRHDGRLADQIRPVSIERGFPRTAAGGVLYRSGQTTVLIAAQLEPGVPPFLVGKGQGWLTAEYAMMPGSTPTRKKRGSDGRSTEIQRLIGRSLRAAVNLKNLGENTLTIDADVIEADGGTRTAAITAAFVAVADAIRARLGADRVAQVLKAPVTAISAGIVNGVPVLDLDYREDSTAEVDLNVVRLGKDDLIEVQGTGEGGTFSRTQLDAMLDLARIGLDQLIDHQKRALGNDWPFIDI